MNPRKIGIAPNQYSATLRNSARLRLIDGETHLSRRHGSQDRFKPHKCSWALASSRDFDGQVILVRLNQPLDPLVAPIFIAVDIYFTRATAFFNQNFMMDLPCSPAAERNKGPILERLIQTLPAQGHALEIASGTGQHITWFAAALSGWTWQPSDTTADGLAFIAARIAQSNLTNIRDPLLLDVLSPQWPEPGGQFETPRFDAIYCANMLHIARWATCAALMQGSARHLAPDGVLSTYGPYLEDGVPTSAGNIEFDASLRASNPAWGIRYRNDVEQEAARAGLHLSARHAMPANNLLLEWSINYRNGDSRVCS